MPQTPKAPTILVLDTEQEAFKTVRTTLAEYGYMVQHCTTRFQALATLRNVSSSIVFVDMDQGDEFGIDSARLLKRNFPSLNIIFMTRQDNVSDAVEAIRLGASDYLHKPLSPADLSMVIRRHHEKIRLEDLAYQAQLQYDNLVQSIPLIIFSLKPDFSLDFINRAVEPILGWTPDEARQEMDWLTNSIHQHDRERVTRLLKSGLGGGETFGAQFRMLHKKGHDVHCMLRTLPGTRLYSDSKPRLEGVIVDISERVYLERSLLDGERVKTLDAISAEVAHEMRNPLMSIGGFANRLKKKAPETAEVDIILREAGRLESLLDRIRKYLKPLRIIRQSCSITSIVNDCQNLLYPEFRRHSITTTLKAEPDIQDIYADPDVLGQTFLNLYTHAMETTPCETGISTEIRSSSANVEVIICSTLNPECAIDPDRLFLPFEEGGRSLKLSQSFRLVRNMGGLLSFAREDDSICFTVSLPFETAHNPELLSELDGNPPFPPPENGDFLERDSAFELQLEREWKRAVRTITPLSVLLIDVDYFEKYSTRYGRKKACIALERIGEAINRELRIGSDFSDGFGTQQFTAILPETNEVGAALVAENIRTAIETMGIEHPCSEISRVMTVSIGAATMVPREASNHGDLLADASEALFLAKQRGRNRTHSALLRI